MSAGPAAALRADPMPLYARIASILRANIADGQWRPGEDLPTIEALCARYGVARVTVRQAVQMLAAEGLLVSRRGRRIAVADGAGPGRIDETVAALAVMPPDHRIDVHACGPSAPPPADVLFLGRPAEGYVRLVKVHAEAGAPYVAMTVYVAADLFARFPDRAWETEKTARLAQRYAVPPLAVCRERITVAAADYDDARLLAYPMGAPIARVRRVFCDRDGRAVYAGTYAHRGDRFGIERDHEPYEKSDWTTASAGA